jgi:hypothetical protein
MLGCPINEDFNAHLGHYPDVKSAAISLIN